ncbi:hypothetical protein ACVDFE_35725 [Lentzea chajnantorensis]
MDNRIKLNVRPRTSISSYSPIAVVSRGTAVRACRRPTVTDRSVCTALAIAEKLRLGEESRPTGHVDAVHGGELVLAAIEQREGAVLGPLLGVRPRRVHGEDAGREVVAGLGSREPADVEVAQRLVDLPVVQEHAPQPVAHVGRQPVRTREPDQGEGVAEVVVRGAHQARVESGPPRDVPQICHSGVQSLPYVRRHACGEQRQAVTDLAPDVIEAVLTATAVVQFAQRPSVFFRACGVGKSDHDGHPEP